MLEEHTTTVFSLEVTTDQLYEFADMVNIECVVIDKDTNVRQLRNELKLSKAVWQ